MLIVGQHSRARPSSPLARNARPTPRDSNREPSRTSGAAAQGNRGKRACSSWIEMNEFLRRGLERVGGKTSCGAVRSRRRAWLSPLDVQCVFIKNQYRSVLIGSSSPREGVCAGVRCVGVWCRRDNGEAHLTNASLSSVGGLGPPKPPLTRHLVSSSERAVPCDKAQGGTRRGQTRGTHAGGESQSYRSMTHGVTRCRVIHAI